MTPRSFNMVDNCRPVRETKVISKKEGEKLRLRAIIGPLF
jgi:hypothetical protein